MTILQPFASAIAAGEKKVENRVWKRTLRDPSGEWIALHAGVGWFGKNVDQVQVRLKMWRRDQGWPDDAPEPKWIDAPVDPHRLPRGAFLGMMRVTEILEYPQDLGGNLDFAKSKKLLLDPWAFGPFCWMISEFRLLEEPIASRGFQQLWNVPSDHLPALNRLL